MPSTRESYVRVLKKETMIFKDPLDTLPHVYAALLLGVLSFERINDRVFMRGLEKGPLVPSEGEVGCKEPKKIKIRRKKKKDMRVQIGSSRIVDFIFNMPPSLPMVSLVRSYVRVVHMPQFGWG